MSAAPSRLPLSYCLSPCQGAIICNLPKSSICRDTEHENGAIWCKMEAGKGLTYACVCVEEAERGPAAGGGPRKEPSGQKSENECHERARHVHVCVPTSLHTRWCQSDPPALKRPTRSPTSRPCKHTSTTSVTGADRRTGGTGTRGTRTGGTRTGGTSRRAGL